MLQLELKVIIENEYFNMYCFKRTIAFILKFYKKLHRYVQQAQFKLIHKMSTYLTDFVSFI